MFEDPRQRAAVGRPTRGRCPPRGVVAVAGVSRPDYLGRTVSVGLTGGERSPRPRRRRREGLGRHTAPTAAARMGYDAGDEPSSRSWGRPTALRRPAWPRRRGRSGSCRFQRSSSIPCRRVWSSAGLGRPPVRRRVSAWRAAARPHSVGAAGRRAVGATARRPRAGSAPRVPSRRWALARGVRRRGRATAAALRRAVPARGVCAPGPWSAGAAAGRTDAVGTSAVRRQADSPGGRRSSA